MANFPTPFNGSAALYPITAINRRPVGIIQFSDLSEQRWKRCGPTKAFILRFTQITWAEANTILTFFDSMKGGFDSTWSITLGGTTYNYMVFDSDVYDLQETERGIYRLELSCRQVRQ